MLRIALINLMPNKEETIEDFANLLGDSPESFEFVLTKMATHVTRHCSEEHMALYRTCEEVCNAHDDGSCVLDACIMTGAPFDWVHFDDVDYWPEECRMMDWLRDRKVPTTYVCWGQQSALHHFHGVERHLKYPNKLSGIFVQQIIHPEHPLFEGITLPLYMPHSRQTEMSNEETDACPDVKVLARAPENGISIVECRDGLEFYFSGHFEYNLHTLDNEYHRDTARNLPFNPPANYYENDDPAMPIIDRWSANGRRIFANWIRYYVMRR